jgi:hypothetical protein
MSEPDIITLQTTGHFHFAFTIYKFLLTRDEKQSIFFVY